MGWLDERAREVRMDIDAVRKIGSELEYLQLGWRPPDGGWSIAQVLEHLIIAEQSYDARLNDVITNGKRGPEEYRPSLVGGFMIRMLQPTSARKIPAPGMYKPAPEPRANVVAEYIKVQEQLLRYIERARGLDLRRNVLTSPVTWLIRMNLGDAIVMSIVHTQRHLQQIERVRSNPAFPKRTGLSN